MTRPPALQAAAPRRGGRVGRALRLLLRCVLWAALSSVTFLASCQSSLIYYPRPYDAAELRQAASLGARRVEARTSQGLQTAFYLPPRAGAAQPPAFLWLVFGGNGARALDYVPDTAGWDPHFGYLFIDYPGYGLCEGRPNPRRIEESLLALSRKLQHDLHWSDAELRVRTGAFGHSLGCAAALIAADRLELRRAVLCAPFTTMTDMARRVVGWPLCLLNRHRFDNVEALRTVAARGAEIRIFHGTDDEVIPVAMGRRLAALFPESVRFTEVRGSHHNDIVPDAAGDIGRALGELAGPEAR